MFHLQPPALVLPSLGTSVAMQPANSQLFRDRIYLANTRRIFDAIVQKRARMMFNLIALGMVEYRCPFHYRRVAKHLYRCRIVEIQFREKQVRRIPTYVYEHNNRVNTQRREFKISRKNETHACI